MINQNFFQIIIIVGTQITASSVNGKRSKHDKIIGLLRFTIIEDAKTYEILMTSFTNQTTH